MFATALYTVKSPQNLGIITRTHVALGGGDLVLLVDKTKQWTYNDTSKYWSRGSHKYVEPRYFDDIEEFVQWKKDEGYQIVAIEIAPTAVPMKEFQYPEKTMLMLGNETVGIPPNILQHCDHIITIPHYGDALGSSFSYSLNVSTAAAIAMYDCASKHDQAQERTAKARRQAHDNHWEWESEEGAEQGMFESLESAARD